MSNLIAKIENWIDETLESHCEQMVPCKQLSSYFDGYFSEKFLTNCFYIVVPELPKPDFPELREYLKNQVPLTQILKYWIISLK